MSMDTRRDGSVDGAGSARAILMICRTRSACASTSGVGGTTNRCEFPDTSSTTSVEGASVAKTEAPLATRRSVNPEPEVTSTARIALQGNTCATAPKPAMPADEKYSASDVTVSVPPFGAVSVIIIALHA